jgi:hypothetical protein
VGRVALPGEINGDAIDRFTLAHFGVGVALGLLGAPTWVAAGWAVGWEIVEDRLKDALPRLFPNATHDTKENALTDAAAVLLGFGAVALARKALR